MKTGFDATDSNTENMITQTGTDLLNQMMIYAIKNACVYAKSAGRDNMSGLDMIIALEYEAHEFCFRNINNKSETQSDDDNDSESDNDESSDESSSDSDIFTKSYSTDPLIQKMNYYHETWDSWNPETEIEKTLKNSVTKAKDMHNQN